MPEDGETMFAKIRDIITDVVMTEGLPCNWIQCCEMPLRQRFFECRPEPQDPDQDDQRLVRQSVSFDELLVPRRLSSLSGSPPLRRQSYGSKDNALPSDILTARLTMTNVRRSSMMSPKPVASAMNSRRVSTVDGWAHLDSSAYTSGPAKTTRRSLAALADDPRGLGTSGGDGTDNALALTFKDFIRPASHVQALAESLGMEPIQTQGEEQTQSGPHAPENANAVVVSCCGSFVDRMREWDYIPLVGQRCHGASKCGAAHTRDASFHAES